MRDRTLIDMSTRENDQDLPLLLREIIFGVVFFPGRRKCGSGVEIGNQLVFQVGDPVFKPEFAFFHPR